MGRLVGKLALITGASRGLGAAVAERYAQEGADLILVARTTKDLESVDDKVKAYGVKSTLVPLDLQEFVKIDELASSIWKRFQRLDILVANAGVLGTLAPIGHIPPDIWDGTIAVNLTANWRLIRAFDPMLKKSEAGRAIFVSSGITQRVAPYWSAYAVSKVALEMMVKIYASEVINTNPSLKINLVDPGIVRTRMRAAAAPGEDPMSIPAPEEITDVFVKLAVDDCTHHGDIVKAWLRRINPL